MSRQVSSRWPTTRSDSGRLRRRLLAPALAAAVLANASAGWAEEWQAVVVSAPAQVVVGDPSTLVAPDVTLINELAGMGFEVSVVDDTAAASVTPGTTVVISTSASSVGAAYRDVPAPVLVTGMNAWNDLLVTTGPDGVRVNTQDLVVVDSAHPIAKGLPTVFAPATGLGGLQSVVESYLPPGADPVAVRSGAENAHVVYTLEAGAVMGDGLSAAPARRMVLGLTPHTLSNLSASGYQLLENAIAWTAEGAAGATRGIDDTTPSAAASGLAVIGRWRLDQIVAATNSTPDNNTQNTTYDGSLDADTTVYDNIIPPDTRARRVTLGADAAGSMYFPGWHDIVDTNGTADPDDDEVDPTDSSVRIAHRSAYNPGTMQSFRAEVYVRPDAIGDVTDPGNPLSDAASLNIAQKGIVPKAGLPDTKGQWKISMNKAMRPVCTFRGDTDSSSAVILQRVEIAAAAVEGIMQAGQDYRIRCDLATEPTSNGGTEKRVRVTLFKKATRPDQSLYFQEVRSSFKTVDAQYFNVVTDLGVWVGKKPNDTEPDDTFAGAIDDLMIYRSAS